MSEELIERAIAEYLNMTGAVLTHRAMHGPSDADLKTGLAEQIAAALEAQLAAARGEVEREVWQPIETAPRDGSWVLTWGEDGIGIAKCYPVPNVQPTGWSPDTTHWIPLPSAPRIGGKEVGGG